MAPLARLAHSLPGRKRVKIDEMRGDPAYFAKLEKELASCPGVVTVMTNPRTGMALISHVAEDASLWNYVVEHELFHLGENEPAAPTAPPSTVGGTSITEHKSYTESGRNQISGGDIPGALAKQKSVVKTRERQEVARVQTNRLAW